MARLAPYFVGLALLGWFLYKFLATVAHLVPSVGVQ